VNRIVRKTMLAGMAAAVLALPACGAYQSGGSTYGEPAGAQQQQSSDQQDTGGDAKDGAGAGAAAPLPKQRSAPASNNALVAKAIPRMGEVVTDRKGHVLYLFKKDTPGTSNCYGDCAAVWPPALTTDSPQLSGVDPALVGTTTRTDGTKQITLGPKKWPLYWYIGDQKTGQWKGQNVGAVWFVIGPNGKPNLTCLPPPSKGVPPPAGSNSSDTAGGSTSDTGNTGNTSDTGSSGGDYDY
jgi:predicted lipoprotein with Yx(FWY)xxD motif